MKIPVNIGELIVEYFRRGSEEITNPVLSQWYAESEENRKELKKYKIIWIAGNILPFNDEFDVQTAWEKIDGMHTRRERRLRRLGNVRYAASGIAAAILLTVGIGLAGLWDFSGKYQSIHAATEYGSRSEIVLPDGTRVSMNAGSRLDFRYAKREKTREVEFSGEAFFEVASNGTPFIINTPQGLQIRVTGTAFNLSAYSDNNRICTSLFEGNVQLLGAGTAVDLAAGEVATFDCQEETFTVAGDLSLEQSRGWMEKKLYMNNTPLAEICRTLERWYNVKITVPEQFGRDICYTGVIQEENVAGIMNAINQLSGINYRIDGNHITIMP